MEHKSRAFMSQSYLNAQENETSATKNYLTSLHSTRKQPSKPLKRPETSSILSPLKPMHPQVYQVEPVNFKELVQRLTGAPEHEAVAKPFKRLNAAAQESSSSLEFDMSSSSWGDLSLQNPANFSRW
uniref:VQ domain-containing protein n=1 Tax=Noccaea caerulescens TaxID=107243 RepID=A0A1J3J6E8_NOCCA